MYYYVATCVTLFLILFIFTITVGSCLFLAGSTVALKGVEEMLNNLDKLPEMMRQGAGQGGPGGDGYQRQGNEDFKEEFKE